MKKYNFLAAIAVLVLVSASCKKFLEIEPQERVLVDNYYQNADQAFGALVSVYDQFANQGGGYLTKVGVMNSASDDQLAGGGGPSDINDFQVISNYTLNSNVGPSGYLWNKGFAGVFRSNAFLEKVAPINMDATLKNRYIAEVKTMRAGFYFDLVRFFRAVPLLTTAVDPAKMYDVVQATPADVYTQIEKDLTEAIPNLPNTVPAATEGGRLTKGAAQALLGKVYLWRDKYADAAKLFAEVNGTPGGTSQYGYKLLANFDDLWKTSNKFNSESILELSHSTASNGGWGNVGSTEGNLLNILVGPRGYKPTVATAPDYVSGWSFQVFTKEFFDKIHFDPRNKATVANLDSLEKNGIATYEKGYNNTGYFVEKFAGRVSNKAATGQLELNFGQNMYEIRLADIYLLEAEALLKSGAAVGAGSRAYQLLNAVRARVKLNPVPVTMDNIMLERRLELAAEGHRWLDLVRWKLAPTVLAFKGFVAGKHEVLPIPQGELNNTKIEQLKEWGGTK
ncbi:RagB/SusD family nutrient uptake outer membrane protein [Daejeonella lutea]|uniref:Starch-binding associating with outer membrane n=1 Tax=Daejeonella lutea TaxID=572036 RepID=A0A1T5AD05_9SPHI|nr:RagB/SusD family nutrient uptake outer membrane protein [Daejeonella lutea]SKB32806.1 Starch-binding associating with outer membrane [Daejeonella lutea]